MGERDRKREAEEAGRKDWGERGGREGGREIDR